MATRKEKPNYISKKFNTNINSKYKLSSNTNGMDIDLEWIDRFMEAVPYIDNIFDSPKRFIINEEVILDIEKTKKVTIESIKHLSKHTNFISEYNEEEDFIKPNKLLNVLKEETFNTYENRFIYTLVDMMEGFISRIEKRLVGLKSENKTDLSYNLRTKVKSEKVVCNLTINTDEKINMNEIAEKIAKIKSHISSWQQSIVYISLKKERVAKVKHPIKRTNVILKNPNFQIAAKLWDYLYNYNEKLNKEKQNDKNQKPEIDKNFQTIIDRSFLINYLIMKNETKKSNIDEELYKENIKEISLEVLNQAMELLLESDSKITVDDIIKIITKRYNEIKQNKKVDRTIIENKIKKEVREIMYKMDSSYFEIESEVIEDGKEE